MSKTRRRSSLSRASASMLPVLSPLHLNVAPWTQPGLELAKPAVQFQQTWTRLRTFTVGALAATQTQSGALLELMGLSIQRKVPLFRDAVAAAKSRNYMESQTKWLGFWFSAWELFQSNTAAVVEIQSRAWRSWVRLFTQLPGGRG